MCNIYRRMPSKSSGRGKGGKKLSFPPDIPDIAGPELWPWPALLTCANIASQTDSHVEASPLGIPEVMAAITSCHTAIATCQTTLTSKIEAVQLDM